MSMVVDSDLDLEMTSFLVKETFFILKFEAHHGDDMINIFILKKTSLTFYLNRRTIKEKFFFKKVFIRGKKEPSLI